MRITSGMTAALLTAGTLSVPALPHPQSAIWTQPVSPSVIATFINKDGEPRAILLWRGKPGWFLGGQRHSSGGGGADGNVSGVEDFGPLRVEYQLTNTSALIQGRRVNLPGGTGVVLVDHVDAPRAQLDINAVAGKVPYVDIYTPLGPVFKAMPGALTFLRCGETLSDERLKLFNRFVCDAPDP